MAAVDKLSRASFVILNQKNMINLHYILLIMDIAFSFNNHHTMCPRQKL